jgi:outer membrane protein
MIKKAIALIASLTLAGSISAADLKIAVVDMNKAFAEYYKTKTAAGKLQDNVNKVKEELNERWAAYKKLMEEAEKLDKARRDPVLNIEARTKKESELQSKAQEIKSLERDIQEFQQRRQGQLQQEQAQERKGIYDEIMVVVNEKSKAGGYDVVLDRSGFGAGGVPFILHTKEGALTDFTNDVIVELNKNAPAAGAADKKADEKKADDKKGK